MEDGSMIISEHTLLFWDVPAGLLAGSEIFLSRSVSRAMNRELRAYFVGVQSRIDYDLVCAFGYLRKRFRKLVIGMFLTILPFIVLTPLVYLTTNHIFLGDVIRFHLVLGFAVGIIVILDVLIPIVTSVGFGLPARGITTLLTRSPKGTVQALGFICLIVSFLIQYVTGG